MEVPLAGVLVDHAGLLQQEVGDHAARGLARVKQDLHILALKQLNSMNRSIIQRRNQFDHFLYIK